MKTDKKNIENELEELGASFLLKQKRNEVSPDFEVENQDIIFSKIDTKNKVSKVRRFPIYLSGIAASIVFTVFLYNMTDKQDFSFESEMAQIQKEDILNYIEDEIIYYSEDDIVALMDVKETNNLFDNSGVSTSSLEEYFINELNEEIQLEELL